MRSADRTGGNGVTRSRCVRGSTGFRGGLERLSHPRAVRSAPRPRLQLAPVRQDAASGLGHLQRVDALMDHLQLAAQLGRKKFAWYSVDASGGRPAPALESDARAGDRAGPPPLTVRAHLGVEADVVVAGAVQQFGIDQQLRFGPDLTGTASHPSRYGRRSRRAYSRDDRAAPGSRARPASPARHVRYRRSLLGWRYRSDRPPRADLGLETRTH